MGWLPDAIQWLTEELETFSVIVTAIATIVLALLTWVLAKATRNMADAMARPHVVAALESNQWSMRHIDLIIENSGNAPAYEVTVKFTPPLPLTDSKTSQTFPFSKVSIIRPGQSLISFVTDWTLVKDQVFNVDISWKRSPDAKKSEHISYPLDMKSLDGVTWLGKLNPELQIAEQIKHIRNDWKSVALGQRRLKSDVFSSDDREKENEQLRAMHDEMRERQKKKEVPDEKQQ